jgi:calpain
MTDIDRSGKLGYEEFKKLWNNMRLWKAAFKNCDKDQSGNFNSFELRQCFHDIGVNVSNQTFNALVQRYSHKDGKIYFDDYIHCIARLTTMFDIYKEMSKGGQKAQFNLDEFIQTTMYS